MAINVGDAVVKITGDNADFKKKIDEVDRKLADVQSRMKGASKETKAALDKESDALKAQRKLLQEKEELYKRQINQLRLMALAITAFGVAGAIAINKLATAAGQATGIFNAFNRMTAEQPDLLNKLRVAVRGTVSDYELMRQVNQALLLGIDINALPAMFEGAFKASQATARPTADAIADVTTGIGRQSRMVLDNLGIIVKAEQAYEKYATSLGKTADQLTEAEQKAAFTAAAMEALRVNAEKIGEVEDSVTIKTQRMSASFDNFKKAIGAEFLGILSLLADKLLQPLLDFMNEHPLVAKMGAAFVLIGTGLALIVGPAILIVTLLPTFATGLGLVAGGMTAVTIAGAPLWAIILAIVAAIAALVAIGYVLIKNWDKIVDFFTGSQRELTKQFKKELEERTKLQKANLEELRADNIAANTKTVEDLRKHYGILEGYAKQENKTLMDLAREASKARAKAIDIEMDALGRAHDEKMRMIDEEFEARVSALDAETNAAIKALEGQLDAMDAEDKASARTEEDMADNKRLRQIQNAITNARNIFEQKRAEKDLVAFQKEMAEKQTERNREDKRAAIQIQIANLREQATNQREALQTEHDAKIKQEEELYSAVKTRLTNEKEGLEEALQAELVRLEKERQAHETAEDSKLAKLQESLAAMDAALQAFHDKEMARLSARAKAGTVTPMAGATEQGWWQKLQAVAKTISAPLSLQGFEGRIPGIPGTPIPAIVHAGEVMGQGGSIYNSVTINNPVVRRDDDITEITRQVSREMYRMQQMRYGK